MQVEAGQLRRWTSPYRLNEMGKAFLVIGVDAVVGNKHEDVCWVYLMDGQQWRYFGHTFERDSEVINEAR